MCVSDWRLGRLIRSQNTQVNTAAGTNTLFLPNRNRVGITLSLTVGGVSAANSMIVTFDNGAAFLITHGNPNVHITLCTHGDFVNRGFVVSGGAVLTTLTVVEYFLPEEVLAAGLNEFRRSLGLSL